MSELIVVGFDGIYRATQVLDQLQVLNKVDLLMLQDAVAVYRNDDGRLHIDESLFPTTLEKTAGGGVLGGVLGALVGVQVGVLVAAPFAAMSLPVAATALAVGSGTMGAVGGAVVGHEDAETFKEMHGITDELVNEVGGMVQPGRSAVFILVHAADPEPVLAQFRGYGGRILRTTLRPVERRRLQETLSEPAATE